MTPRLANRIAATLAVAVLVGGCGSPRRLRPSSLDEDSGTRSATSNDAGEPLAPPLGMVWVTPGPLVVGTAPNAYPRRPDRELAGEQVVLHGFYIDKLPYPNEEGAIPTTNVGQAEARARCEMQGKRLCTELEWERACKGPSQHTFEYGDVYREDICGTGTPVVPRPSGINVGCQSDFGVHDMHGSVFEWTDSGWNRGDATPNHVSIRGGNDITADVVARCANAEPRPKEAKAPSVGFRCCAGPANEAEVLMRVERGPSVTAMNSDPALLKRMFEHVTAEAVKELKALTYVPVWTFVWRPVGNERLVAISMCSRSRPVQRCAMFIGRDTPGVPTVLGAASTGFIPSKLYVDEGPRDAWVLGTDAMGPFRRLLRYNWGRLEVGPRELQTKPKKSTTSKHSSRSKAAN